MNIDETFELERFVEAQQGTYNQARSELAVGEKRSHWSDPASVFAKALQHYFNGKPDEATITRLK